MRSWGKVKKTFSPGKYSESTEQASLGAYHPDVKGTLWRRNVLKLAQSSAESDNRKDLRNGDTFRFLVRYNTNAIATVIQPANIETKGRVKIVMWSQICMSRK